MVPYTSVVALFCESNLPRAGSLAANGRASPLKPIHCINARAARRSVRLCESSKVQNWPCAACGKWDAGGGAVALKRCANCRAIFYCSPACQKKNWKMHKKGCKQLKAEREAARVADGIGQLRV